MEILLCDNGIDQQEVLSIRGVGHKNALPKEYLKGSPVVHRIDEHRIVLLYHLNQYAAIKDGQLKVRAIMSGSAPDGGIDAPAIKCDNPLAEKLSPLALGAVLSTLRKEQADMRQAVTHDMLVTLSKEFVIPAPEGDRLAITITARHTVRAKTKGPKVTPKGTPRGKNRGVIIKKNSPGSQFSAAEYEVIRALISLAGDRLKSIRESERIDAGTYLDVI